MVRITNTLVASYLLLCHLASVIHAFACIGTHARTHSIGFVPLETALSMQEDDDLGGSYDVGCISQRETESLVASGSAALLSPPTPGTMRDPSVGPTTLSSTVTFKSFGRVAPLPSAPTLDVSLPTPPRPLTTTARERRLCEIQLLEKLPNSDEALMQVAEVWFLERGAEAAELVHKANTLIINGPEGFKEAEEILSRLVEAHATLCQLQGRSEEALELNKVALAIKPWHFGSISQVVMVLSALGDNDSARVWANFRIPQMDESDSNRAKKQWVDWAVASALMRLERGEARRSC